MNFPFLIENRDKGNVFREILHLMSKSALWTKEEWTVHDFIWNREKREKTLNADVVQREIADLLPTIPEEFADNAIFILKSTMDNPFALLSASDRLRSDRDFNLLCLCGPDYGEFAFIFSEFQDDTSFISEAINYNAAMLEFLPESAPDYRHHAENAVAKGAGHLQHASLALRNNLDFVKIALNSPGSANRFEHKANVRYVVEESDRRYSALPHIGQEALSSAEAVLECFETLGHYDEIKNIPSHLRNNRNLVINLCTKYDASEVLDTFASTELQNDPELRILAGWDD
jgi:hypothetical protein